MSRCEIDVADDFEFETAAEVFDFESSGGSECEALLRTYAVAIEAWYAQYGDTAGHPSGDDLVTNGFVNSYDDDLVEVVEGSGASRSQARSDSCEM